MHAASWPASIPHEEESVACCDRARGGACACCAARCAACCFPSRRCCGATALSLALAAQAICLVLAAVAPAAPWLNVTTFGATTPCSAADSYASCDWSEVTFTLDGRAPSSRICGNTVLGTIALPGGYPGPNGTCISNPPWFLPWPLAAVAGPGAPDAAARARSLAVDAAVLVGAAAAVVGGVLLPMASRDCGAGCSAERGPTALLVAVAATLAAAALDFSAAGVFDAGVKSGADGALAGLGLAQRSAAYAADGYALAISSGVLLLGLALPALAAANCLGRGWLFGARGASKHAAPPSPQQQLQPPHLQPTAYYGGAPALPQALPFFGQAPSTTYYSYAAVPSSAPAVYDAASAAAAAPPLAPSLPLPMQQSQPYHAAAAQAQPYYVSAASTAPPQQFYAQQPWGQVPPGDPGGGRVY